MNIQEAIQKSSEKLKKTSPTPQLDAEILLSHVLKKSREFILTYPEKKLSDKQIAKFNDFTKKRLQYEPIAYITSQREFYGLDFKVNKHTLIPRPETEILVENILKMNPKNKTIFDLGTGSGNIIISLAKNLKNKNNYFGVDISLKALAVAKHNAKKNKVEKKIKFIKSDLLNYFIKNNLIIKKFNNLIIIANLPYLSKKIYSSCTNNVKKFEPKSALLSGIDGLDHYEKLFQQLKKISLIIDNCLLILEISP